MKRKPVALFLSAIVMTGCADFSPTETISTDSNSTPSSTSTSPISTTTSNTKGTSMPSDTSEISTTGTGGTIEEQIDAYFEATEEIKETEEAEIEDTTPVSTTPKYTLAEDPEEDEPTQTVNTQANKQGDYTAGGYLPTTANSKYRENGLKFGMDSGGILFRDGETQDLYNWVSAGYTKWRTEDVRIASRKGGIDNPRIATYLSLDNNDDWFAVRDTDYCVVTVMKGTYNNLTDEVREICENYVQNGDKTKEGNKEARDAAMAYGEKEGLDTTLNYYADSGEYNTMVRYNCRNYCGDTIYIEPSGDGVVKTNINPSGGSVVGAAAGIDYILTCDEDPEAFKLVKEDELKQMYESNRKGLKQYTGSAYNVNAAYIEGYSGKTEAGISNKYHQAYIGVKPGIYRCTLTIPSTGDKFDIVIENLPVHYEKLQWGCSTQEEMDFCVQFMQGWEYGLFGQYYHARYGQVGANLFGVNNNTHGLKDKLAAVDFFNNERDFLTFEGESIKLKKTEEAAEWVAHLPCAAASACLDEQIGGLRLDTLVMEERLYTGLHARCTSYDALDSIMYGAEDCESLSASVSCLWNVLGYTTRYVTGGNHAWFEVKVPASITKSGKDQWLMVNNGVIAEHKSSIQKKSHVYDEVEGMDNSWWNKCYNPEIIEWLKTLKNE